jgi:hypothetical protein
MSPSVPVTPLFRSPVPQVAQAFSLCAQLERLCYFGAGLRNLFFPLILLPSARFPRFAISNDSQGGKPWDSWNE